jgi:AmmeMemoRadiSam system protein A/AmmeMemoRadiSam system protein B
MSSSSVVFAGIAPHPPIMVPEVGGAAASEVRSSIEAMREFTERIIANKAETVVIVSPHAPLEARAFVAYADSPLFGNFANFRAPHATVEAALDVELLDAISRAAIEDNYPVIYIEDSPLDHGTVVPLYFLQRNGWQGSVVAFGYSFLSDEDHVRFGACIKRATDAMGRRVAFVASGDLSHRLKMDAPAGYEPDAYLFDKEVVESLRACAPERLVQINQNLRRMAGECGYRSMLVAVGVVEGSAHACEVLHYEAPFGVGYMVAQLANASSDQTRPSSEKQAEKMREVLSESDVTTKEQAQNSSIDEEILPALACRAVETFIRDRRIIEPPVGLGAQLLQREAACFVSIKTVDGQLRGCIGTIEPTQPTLAEELIANAISAATRDPRFPPVAADELSHLCYSVDVLSKPEPAQFEDLNPAIFGLIVEDETGTQRGLLLPDIEGIETAAQQVEIATRKAGITPSTTTTSSLKLYRFRVRRFRELARFHQPSEQRRSTNMTKDKQVKTSLGESHNDSSLEPGNSAPNPIEELNPANDERALDVGESGQFAPGGRYNELGVTAPRRIDLDEQVDSALRNDKK